MESKQATVASATSHPLGMCEKLFNAFKPTLHPLRRLTFRHHQELGAANNTNPSLQIHQTKLPKPTVPPQVQEANYPKTETKLLPLPARPMAEVVPSVTVPQALPPPKSEKATKKGINEKVDEYITRTKGKIKSTASSVGKVAGSK